MKMGLMTEIGNLFAPNMGESTREFRLFGMAASCALMIAAVAGKIFGTMSAIESLLIGGVGAAVFIGSAIGSVGIVAMAAIVVMGVAMATPVGYGGHMWVYYPNYY